MRRLASTASLVGLALALTASPAAAEPVKDPPKDPSATGPDEQVEEEPYDPAKHEGWSEGAWLRATRGTARRSTGMMATGITLLAVGVTFLGAGVGVAAAGPNCNTGGAPSSGSVQGQCGARSGPTVGAVLSIAGFIGIGIGLPLTVLGASEVPRWEAGKAPAAPRGPTIGVVLGLHRAGLALTF